MIFTPEQEKVLQTNLAPGQVAFVKAIAGAGKTSTLIEYMRRRPHIRFLYLAYNRSAIDEVRNRILAINKDRQGAEPELSNVTCRTIDSLAASSNRVQFTGPKKWSHFWFGAWPTFLQRQRRREKYPIELVEFFYEASETLVRETGLLVSALFQQYVLSNTQQLAYWLDNLSDTADPMVRLHTEYIWKAVCSGKLESPDFSWTVKAVAELGETLEDLGCLEVETLIIDEAQDINWPMWTIISNQLRIPERPPSAMLVGDPNQHLYSFRQCISVFDQNELAIQPEHFTLTKSCRFGPCIAEHANTLLKGMQCDINVGTIHEKRLDKVQKVGFNFPKDLDVVVASLPAGERAAVLFQSNKAMLYCYLNCSHLDIEILGSAFNLHTLNQLWDEYLLNPLEFAKNQKVKSNLAYTPNRIQDPDLVESLRDELLFSEFIVRNASKIPNLITRLHKTLHAKEPSKATLVFATVHQAKGREFHTVILHPGLRECRMQLDRKLRDAILLEAPQPIAAAQLQIKNFNYLYYTAVTRACHRLIIP